MPSLKNILLGAGGALVAVASGADGACVENKAFSLSSAVENVASITALSVVLDSSFPTTVSDSGALQLTFVTGTDPATYSVSGKITYDFPSSSSEAFILRKNQAGSELQLELIAGSSSAAGFHSPSSLLAASSMAATAWMTSTNRAGATCLAAAAAFTYSTQGVDAACNSKLQATITLPAGYGATRTSESGKIRFTIGPVTSAPTTKSPTANPTTKAPTTSPTTKAPTTSPTTRAPTTSPTTRAPTTSPTTKAPTTSPTTSSPTTPAPTRNPVTSAPTMSPSMSPTTMSPSMNPTASPTICETGFPDTSVGETYASGTSGKNYILSNNEITSGGRVAAFRATFSLPSVPELPPILLGVGYAGDSVLETSDFYYEGFLPQALTSENDLKASIDFGMQDFAMAAVFDTMFHLYIVGYSLTTSPTEDGFVSVARIDDSGALDTTFGGSSDGKVQFNFVADAQEAALAIAIDSSNQAIIAGFVHDSTNGDDFHIIRLSSDGSLDAAFGTAGRSQMDFDGEEDRILSVAIQSSGEIVVVGYATVSGLQGFAIARFTSEGLVDTSFRTTGSYVDTSSFDSSQLSSVILDSNTGDIFAVGSATTDNGSGGQSTDFLIARFASSDGSLGTIFGSADLATYDFGDISTTRSASANAITSGNGMIFIAGGKDGYVSGIVLDSDADLLTEFAQEIEVSPGTPATQASASGILFADSSIYVAGFADDLSLVAKFCVEPPAP